ncbi:MAG: type VI secretion system protein TssA [Pirellulaceae bacterium]
MAEFDVDALLVEVSPEEPCGPDLEYDEAFSEMERASQGKPEQQYGDTVIDAEEPQWSDVKAHAIQVLKRSKDLRAAVYLAKATLFEDGIVSFRDTLAIVRGYLERYWESVHPQLDPEDDNDPTIRANTLNGLCHVTVLDALRAKPLVTARGLRVSYRDIALAKGEMTLPEDSAEDILGMTAVNSVFESVDIAALNEIATAVSESLAHAQTIEAVMTEHVGAYDTCNLDPLTKVLVLIDKFLQEKVAARPATESPIQTPAETSPNAAGTQSSAVGSSAGRATVPAFNGAINSREDAIRALDCICQYFERYEPSSPLPLLLRRAKRLSTKSFIEILKDISPDIVSQAEAMGGVDIQEASGGYSSEAAENNAVTAESAPRESAPRLPATNEGY